jgi:CHAD domain-containing protein
VRVATRRLRSDLRTFRPLVDRAWSTSLRDELDWLARLLGEVRDGDVLLERLRERASELSEPDQDAVAPVLASLAEARNAALTELLEALRGPRYIALLDRLVEAANAPALRDDAEEAAVDVAPHLVRRPWHKLTKRAEALGEHPSDADLHDVRIRAKRARYAAEAVAPVAGKGAQAFAKAAARLQDVLGDLHDAVVAAAWLEGWARQQGAPAERLGAHALEADERAAAQHLRGSWREAWEELEEQKLRAWI